MKYSYHEKFEPEKHKMTTKANKNRENEKYV